MKVFVDTNILVAAFATRGLCADVLRIVLAEHELVSSAQVLEELERVLREKLKLPPPRIKELIRFVRDQALFVEPESPAPWPQSDLDDQWIIAAALKSGSDVLVTGDRDLLDITGKVVVEILDPRRFWERVGGK